MQVLTTDKRLVKQGFTLIEMCIVLVILGLFIAAYFPIYDLYVRQMRITDTQNHVSRVAEYIGHYRRIHGRYPRPAPFDAAAGDAKYGREYEFSKTSAQALADFSAGATPGTCTLNGNKICMQKTQDASRVGPLLSDPDFDVANGTEAYKIMVGAVPFKDLGLQEEDSLDGYGIRLTYAVTANLTDSDRYSETAGGIEIHDENGHSLLVSNDGTQTSIGHYVVLSHGENGYGGYTQQGGYTGCAPYVGGDRDNSFECSSGINGGVALYRYQDANLADGDQYDDFMMYSSKADAGVWQLSESNPDDQHLINLQAVLSANRDADADAAQPDLVVQDNGDLRIREKVRADVYCDLDGNNCFHSVLMAGDPEDTSAGVNGSGGRVCPDGQYIVSIKDDAINCAAIKVACPSGQYIGGIDAEGELICKGPPVPGCEATTKPICGEDKDIPAGSDGSGYTLTGGDNKAQYYKCSDQEWKYRWESGYCTCEDELNATVAVNICDQGAGSPYSGEVYQQTIESCDGDGQIVQTVTYSGGTGIEDCDCTDITDETNFSCSSEGYGNAYTGYVKKRRTYNCATDSWGGYDEIVENTCSCTDGTKNLPDQACTGLGMTGAVKVTEVTDCTTGTKKKVYDYSGCICQDIVDTDGVQLCDAATQNGSVLRYEDVVCGADKSQPGTLTTRTEIIQACTNKEFRWKINGNVINTFSSPVGVKEGSSCEVSQNGHQEKCWVRNFSGDYDSYLCECNPV